ncbi:M67 family metallopeptidase [Thiohalorhabdus sp.]|uniref:M67 family metallopeptidase n=1 Tax=Thiohalorhabdus sp. TaxID=3094134 RepID=UPI002FC3CBAF
MPGVLRLPARLHRELIGAAAASPDEEVCGLLGGRDGRADEQLPVPNAVHRPDAFDMAPAELIAAMRHLRETGQELVAIYHSHPCSPPYPSATDIAANQYPEVVHLIIGREGGEWRVRAFWLDGEIEEVGIRITN